MPSCKGLIILKIKNKSVTKILYVDMKGNIQQNWGSFIVYLPEFEFPPNAQTKRSHFRVISFG